MNTSIQPNILVADDERSIRLMLETGLTLNGFRVTAVRTGREAQEAAATGEFDAVLSDIYMPDGGGLELVDALRTSNPNLPIVLMTAQGSLEVAVEAVARGATDFIGKPFEISAVVELLRRILSARREQAANAGAEAPESQLTNAGLVGRSAPMIAVYKLVAQAARTEATVLIMGESGTGKELVARAIHDFSSRRSRPFLSVNCSGLTDTLLEAELFGHTRGAFTGAATERAGLFEAADGGTLFLDELASTSPAFQASLLRVLQSGEVRRVGSPQSRRVNVRVIGASNAPLRDLVAAGTFRSDLFYRLSVLSIELPPLRQRMGDIEILTNHFLQLFREGGDPALALSSGGLITIDCLPREIAAQRTKAANAVEPPERRLLADRPTMEELQRRYLQLILEETGWNRRRAASVLDLDRRTIQRLIARYQLNGATDLESDPESEEETTERSVDIT
jgi:DNA-binding NtrC family response regulator